MVPSARSNETFETRPMTGADTTMHVMDALRTQAQDRQYPSSQAARQSGAPCWLHRTSPPSEAHKNDLRTRVKPPARGTSKALQQRIMAHMPDITDCGLLRNIMRAGSA